MLIIRTVVLYLAVLGAGLFAPLALAKPPAEAFGEPTVTQATMSPDGKNVATFRPTNDGDYIVITDIATGESRALASLGAVKPQGLTFVSPNHVIAYVSRTQRTGRRGDKFEDWAAIAFDVRTGQKAILDGGGVVGLSEDNASIFMTGWVSRGGASPTNGLFKVDLTTGKSEHVTNAWGTSSTIDWIVTPKGEAQIREEFFTSTGKHDVLRYDGSDWVNILTEKTGELTTTFYGVRASDHTPIFSSYVDDDQPSLFALDLASGEKTPMLDRADADFESFVIDTSRVIHGVRYSGMTPRYKMFDPAIDSAVRKVQKALGGASTYLTDWSTDWTKMLFYSEGGGNPGEYYIFDRTKGSVQPLIASRPDIPDDAVAEVASFEYAARDGLKIPALVTWPVGVATADRKDLPVIVLPHGGPASYDSIGFDMMAQFFANEGYAVLQPNFRGSSGFGDEFEEAGHGQWGRKMQDDVSDGLADMVAKGAVNPKRVCIVGWSYGGYAALAGGALTPELYACVVSVAGVSDLRDMLEWEYDRLGEKNPGYRYWVNVIGDLSKDGAAIDAVSPARLASRFRAPVLLIHGNDDTTVPASQSSRMNDALKGAGKKVTFQRILGDDHDLGIGQNRKIVFEAMSAFIAASMPPG